MARKLAFIGGAARTGTTMLHGLLSESPETSRIMREAIYLRLLTHAYDYLHDDVDIGGHTADFFDSGDEFRAFHKSLLDRYLDHVEARFGPGKLLIQKQPRMTPMLPSLAQLYPEAKFVIMTRDLRDVVASQIVRARRENPKIEISSELIRKFVGEYTMVYAQLMARKSLMAGRMLLVRYEALCTDMAPVMREICGFLEIDDGFVSADMNWAFKRPKTDSSASDLDGQPVSSGQIGAYRRVLPGQVIQILTNAMPDLHKQVGIALAPGADPAGGRAFEATQLLAA